MIRRPRLDYGWICVGVAALTMVATLPGRTIGLGVVTEPLLRDLHLSRTTFGAVNLWATLLGAGFGLNAGRLLDRYGSRAILTVVSAALGLVVLWMSRVSGLGWLFIGVTLTRGLGRSALSTASIAAVGKWFGWRPAWGGMGLVVLIGMAPVAWLLMRQAPQATAIPLDGTAADDDGRDADMRGLTLSAALATPAFWAIALGGLLFNTAYSGITLFNESILAERGFHGSPTGPLLVIVLTGLPANFGAGWASGRYAISRVLAVAMLLLAASLLALPLVHTPPGVMAYAAALGVSGGVVTVVFFACWRKVFGRRHLGRIQGAAQGLPVLASAAGPMLLAESQSGTGSYDAVFYALAPLAAALGVICWFVPLPRASANEPSP